MGQRNLLVIKGSYELGLGHALCTSVLSVYVQEEQQPMAYQALPLPCQFQEAATSSMSHRCSLVLIYLDILIGYSELELRTPNEFICIRSLLFHSPHYSKTPSTGVARAAHMVQAV